MTQVLLQAAALALLALAGWLPGYALLRRLPALAGLGSGLRRLAEIVLGLAAWTLWLFGLGATGGLGAGGLALGLALALAAALTARARGRPRPPPARREPVPTAGRCFALFLGLVLLGSALVTLGPGVSWDASVYHLTVPKLYLAAGGFRPIPMNVYSNWPLGTELFFAAALQLDGPALARLVHWGFGLLALYGLFVACRELEPEATPVLPWLAMALFLANEWVAYELTVAYIDLAHAFYLLAGFVFLLRARRGGAAARASLWLAGLCGGLLAGVKLSGVVGAGLLATLWLPELAAAARRGALAPALGGFALRFGAPALLLWLPWLAKSAWATGNPFYPFGYAQLGGPHWSEALAAQFSAWHASIGMGRGPVDTLLLPLRIALPSEASDAAFHGRIAAFWLLLVPVALVFGRGRALVLPAVAVAGLFFAVWAATSQQARLLLPALPLLALAGAGGLAGLLERLPPARRRASEAATLVAAALLVLAVHWGNVRHGAEHLLLLRDRGAIPEERDPVYAFIEGELPPEARLLLVNHNQGFYVEREYLADSFFQASQVADWLAPARDVPELSARLAEGGVTHVLVEKQAWGIEYTPALASLLADPRRARVLYQDGEQRFTLFELLR